MPSAGFLLTAVTAPLLAGLFYYPEAAKSLTQSYLPSLLKMTQATNLVVAPHEIAQPVRAKEGLFETSVANDAVFPGFPLRCR